MISSKNPDSSKDLSKLISTYTKHWLWFVLSVMVCFVGAFFHLRYTTPEYIASAKIMLLNDDTGTPASAILQDLSSFSDNESTKVEDEIEILKSRSLMENVVKKLDLNLRYYTEGRFHFTQLYPNPPIKVNFISKDSVINASTLHIDLNIKSKTSFDYIFKEGDIPKQGFFGKSITSPIGDLVIVPTVENISNLVGRKMFIDLKPTYTVADKYKEKIRISRSNEFSKVINISLNDPVVTKAKRIIDTLISEYNRTSIEAKNIKSKSTADFIDERISLISADLSRADDKIQQFKTGNKLTDITSEADLYLSSSAATEQELAARRTELNMANYMKSQINDNEFSRIPANVGLNDGTINNMVTRYNELLDNRERLLKSSSEKNPIVVNLDEQLDNIKSGLQQSLNNTSKTMTMQIRSLENRSSKLSSKIFAVPGQVRKSRDIEREQGTKESLFLYLLEKREEATISLTSTSPNAKIIDSAYNSNVGPVSPKKNFTYLASIMLGLVIPFMTIYVRNLFQTKIQNKEDLEGEINDIVVLGEIPRTKKGDNMLIERNDRSILSESFRIIRTNADYIRKGRKVEDYNNVIFVTSTINGEGKSFFSMNMALTIANTGKKVLLIGADIRNPQIFTALNNSVKDKDAKSGLTEFLVDTTIGVKDVVNQHAVNDIELDVLLSGKVPPNPAELLMGDRVKELFDRVSDDYDYVIVDTAPSMLVTDTILISQYAGHTIYLTRADYTEKEILNFARELHEDRKLNGMMLVVNDVKQSNFGYGAKYGYYGTPKKKKWYSFSKS